MIAFCENALKYERKHAPDSTHRALTAPQDEFC